MAKRSTVPTKTARLDRSEWIALARSALIKDGIAGVRVEPLAAKLGVTTGSFYHHFKNRGELLSELISDWELTNTRGMIEAVRDHVDDPYKQMHALNRVWIDEIQFDPAYDSAMRDWARASAKVEKVVRRVDDERIALLTGIYQSIGYRNPEAMVRARILYFHQVGYYALHIKESHEERMKLLPYYERALLGPKHNR